MTENKYNNILVTGLDCRYAINCDKIKKELNRNQKVNLKKELDTTVNWYIANSNN